MTATCCKSQLHGSQAADLVLGWIDPDPLISYISSKEVSALDAHGIYVVTALLCKINEA